jgi:uncharacterized SAM-binding protein YcdF (DUF218 family)
MNIWAWSATGWRGAEVTAARAMLAGIAAILIFLLASVADFTRRMAPADPGFPVAQAVVFTGQFDRIRHGLTLLDAGQIGRLLVSGVNPGAGLTPERFITRFAPDAPGLHRMREAGLLELGLRAANTFGNALETACWYRRAGLSGPLVLITSRAHMPRASRALEARLPGVEIRRVPVGGSAATPAAPRQRWQAWRREFPRYLATRLALLYPRRPDADCT